MSRERDKASPRGQEPNAETEESSSSLLGALTARYGRAAVQRRLQQRRKRESTNPGEVQEAAARGTSGAADSLPFADKIQKSFGRHDVSSVRAHQDDQAREGAEDMGAEAFATGNHIAFARAPDLHTAAHEAAHVVQQRGEVQLYGGVGKEGDEYEKNADEVADRVVRGESSEALLDQHAPGDDGAAVAGQGVQRIVCKEDGDEYKADRVVPKGAKILDGLSATEQDEIQKLHKDPSGKVWKFDDARTEAKKRAAGGGAGGKFNVGRGTPLADTDAVLSFMESSGADTSVAKQKFEDHPDLFEALMKNGIVEEDFDMKASSSGQASYGRVSAGMTSGMAAQARTISGFNEVAKMATEADSKMGAAMKGPAFEKWVFDNVLPNAKGRVSFSKKGAMGKSRQSDGYDSATKTLWDAKHYPDSKAPADQAADYAEILKHGYKADGGETVASVAYVFPTLEGAMKNVAMLNTQYGFSVYYIASGNKLTQVA
jgi:hypothetical protein